MTETGVSREWLSGAGDGELVRRIRRRNEGGVPPATAVPTVRVLLLIERFRGTPAPSSSKTVTSRHLPHSPPAAPPQRATRGFRV